MRKGGRKRRKKEKKSLAAQQKYYSASAEVIEEIETDSQDEVENLGGGYIEAFLKPSTV